MLTESKIDEVFGDAPKSRVEEFTRVFNKYAKNFGIDSEVQINFFLAQIRVEVGPSLKPRRENLNYSCSALTSMFSYYRKHRTEAVKDGRCAGHKANQRNIGNKIYANRIGNGDVKSGDGYKFRGAFYIQLTGRANWTDVSKLVSMTLGEAITVKDMAERADSVEMALVCSLAYWFQHEIYKVDNIDEATAIINKHTDTYDERKKQYLRIASL